MIEEEKGKERINFPLQPLREQKTESGVKKGEMQERRKKTKRNKLNLLWKRERNGRNKRQNGQISC